MFRLRWTVDVVTYVTLIVRDNLLLYLIINSNKLYKICNLYILYVDNLLLFIINLLLLLLLLI